MLLECTAIFEEHVRPNADVDAEVHKFVAIDVETGTYEIDESDVEATDRLVEREPEAEGRIWLRRVGYERAHRLGAFSNLKTWTMGLVGRVTAEREARIPFLMRSEEGAEHEVNDGIDTGFNGVLGLSTRLIDELGLAGVVREWMLLANGEFHFARMCRAIVNLEDSVYSVRAVEAGDPLAGMGLRWEETRAEQSEVMLPAAREQ